jgi:hypothetical protein
VAAEGSDDTGRAADDSLEDLTDDDDGTKQEDKADGLETDHYTLKDAAADCKRLHLPPPKKRTYPLLKNTNKKASRNSPYSRTRRRNSLSLSCRGQPTRGQFLFRSI